MRSGFSIVFTGLLIRRMQCDDEPDDPTTWFGSRQNYHKLVLRGVFGACAMCSYYFSIQLLTLGDAVTLFFTNAVVTAVASVLLSYEKPTWGMLIACCTCAGTLHTFFIASCKRACYVVSSARWALHHLVYLLHPAVLRVVSQNFMSRPSRACSR